MDSKTTKDKTQDFNPAEHLTQIKGKDYLEVKWRLVWFRQERPTWSLETESVKIENNSALFKAYVKDETGRIIATAHKREDVQGFGDFIEKAETGAIGRALALVGFGTQFAPELEEGQTRIVDAPIEHKTFPPAQEMLRAKAEVDSSNDLTTRIRYLYKIWHELGEDTKAMNTKTKDKFNLFNFNEITSEQLEEEIRYYEEILRAKDWANK